MTIFNLIVILFLSIACNFKEPPREPKDLPPKKPSAKNSIKKETPAKIEIKRKTFIRYRGNMSSSDEIDPLILGKFFHNSSAHLQVSLDKRWGEYFIPTPHAVEGIRCYLKFHPQYSLNKPRTTFGKDLDGEFMRLEFFINESSFRIQELVEHDQATAYWLGEVLHVDIKDFSEISYSLTNERTLFLGIAPFDEWELEVNFELNNLDCPDSKYPRSFYEHFSITFNSTIENEN